MSIALLAQVYDETRRLAIAGSVVAPGDFRIKKLIAPLEQAGAKVPVFAKVAEGIKAVVDASDKTSAQALLDLATLVNAILNTQGETGAPGDLKPIETIDLGLSATQTSARVLKPLLEALSTTGSGRLELIKDAHERGAFRDLRLIQPAVAAIDDVFGELAEFVAERILPLYGKAILPMLRSSFDMKGRAGHPRRLRLMHQLDPAGARELVKQALENGSKEVKVVAIECLGAERDDLSYLLEQATAKANEVRQAAYRALATIDDDAVLTVLQKAFAGKDLTLAAPSLKMSRNAKLLKFVLAGIEAGLAELRKLKDKKEISAGIGRLTQMLQCLEGRDDTASEALLLQMFADRDGLAKIRGDTTSGSDLISVVVGLMARGTPRMRATLVDHHASLDARDLDQCFLAARTTFPADKVFAIFSPYVTAKVDEKKKGDPAYLKRMAIAGHLLQRRGQRPPDALPPVDPRWLDVAVHLEDLLLVDLLIRPGHLAANAFLSRIFAEKFNRAKNVIDCIQVTNTMVRAEHPNATDAVIATLEKFSDKAGYHGYYVGDLVTGLSKSALPRLEALVPKLHERVADSLLGYMQQLRDKT
jgi:HEAT repeats